MFWSRRLSPSLITLVTLVLASIFGIYAISFPTFWILAPVSLGLFIYGLWELRSMLQAGVYGFLYGLATGSAGIWWFWDTLPLDWIGLSHGPNQTYFVFASFAPVACVLALAIVPGAMVLWLLRHHPLRTLALVPIWVLSEELRMWNFSFLTYSVRSLIGPHFSTASLGYALAENHHLLQLAYFGGVAALNAAVAVGAGLIALTIARSWRSSAFCIAIAGTLILFLVPFAAPTAKSHGESFTAVLIQTDIPVGQKEPTHITFTSLLDAVHSSFPEASLIVIPEEFQLEPRFETEAARIAYIRKTFAANETLIVHSEHEAIGSGFQNALVYLSETGERVALYRKMFLMPGGEYMPYLMTAVFSLRPDTGLGQYMNHLAQERLTPTGLVAVPFKGHVLGGLICSDALSPQLYHFLARKHDADIFINSANPAWFHHSQILFDKTIQMAKVHAAQHRTYYLQSSNGSPAFAINPYGTIVGMTEGNGLQYLEVSIPE